MLLVRGAEQKDIFESCNSLKVKNNTWKQSSSQEKVLRCKVSWELVLAAKLLFEKRGKNFYLIYVHLNNGKCIQDENQ